MKLPPRKITEEELAVKALEAQGIRAQVSRDRVTKELFVIIYGKPCNATKDLKIRVEYVDPSTVKYVDL